MSTRALPQVTSSTLRSPALTDRVLAICAGSIDQAAASVIGGVKTSSWAGVRTPGTARPNALLRIKNGALDKLVAPPRDHVRSDHAAPLRQPANTSHYNPGLKPLLSST
jgi:hypothetical protein